MEFLVAFGEGNRLEAEPLGLDFPCDVEGMGGFHRFLLIGLHGEGIADERVRVGCLDRVGDGFLDDLA